MFALFGWIKHLQKKLKTPRLFDSEHSSLFPVRPIFPCTLQHADRTGQFTKRNNIVFVSVVFRMAIYFNRIRCYRSLTICFKNCYYTIIITYNICWLIGCFCLYSLFNIVDSYFVLNQKKGKNPLFNVVDSSFVLNQKGKNI